MDTQVNGSEPPVHPEKQLDVSDKIDHDRLTAIADARQAVRQVREQGAFEVMRREIPQKQAALAFRKSIESYLLEIKQYRNIDETAQEYWTGTEDKQLGSVKITPPDEEPFSEGDPRIITVNGLNDVLYAPIYYEAEFEDTIEARHGPNQTQTRTVREPLPRYILDRAVEWANAYVHHIGLDLKLEKTVEVSSDIV